MKPKPFHATNFIGGAGPGLAKLRAASVEAETAPKPKQAVGGLDRLRELMRRGRWPEAIYLACKWSDLGDQAAVIHRGREALLRPYFQVQLKRDPSAMIEEAKAALTARYGNV